MHAVLKLLWPVLKELEFFYFFSVCWSLSPQQLTGSTWSYKASQRGCNGIHSLAESTPVLRRKHTVLEIGSKMVCAAQRLEIRNCLESGFSLLHAFLIISTLVMLCLWWISSPALPVWLQQWKWGSWRCLVLCRKETEILTRLVQAGNYFLSEPSVQWFSHCVPQAPGDLLTASERSSSGTIKAKLTGTII